MCWREKNLELGHYRDVHWGPDYTRCGDGGGGVGLSIIYTGYRVVTTYGGGGVGNGGCGGGSGGGGDIGWWSLLEVRCSIGPTL